MFPVTQWDHFLTGAKAGWTEMDRNGLKFKGLGERPNAGTPQNPPRLPLNSGPLRNGQGRSRPRLTTQPAAFSVTPS